MECVDLNLAKMGGESSMWVCLLMSYGHNQVPLLILLLTIIIDDHQEPHRYPMIIQHHNIITNKHPHSNSSSPPTTQINHHHHAKRTCVYMCISALNPKSEKYFKVAVVMPEGTHTNGFPENEVEKNYPNHYVLFPRRVQRAVPQFQAAFQTLQDQPMTTIDYCKCS